MKLELAIAVRLPRWIVVALAAAALMPAANAAERVESVPLGSRISVDGDVREWDGIPVHFLADTVHVLSVAHDADTLYVMFRFSEPRLARSIMRRGVVLWVDGDAKEKTSFGVRYGGSEALAKALGESRGDDGERRGRRPPDGGERTGMDAHGKRPRVPNPGTLTVISGDTSRVRAEQLPGGPVAASAVQDGVYCYELAIPLSMVGGEVLRRPATEERRIALGVQIGGLSKAERKAMRAGGGSGFRVGFGGAGAEVRGGDRGGRRAEDEGAEDGGFEPGRHRTDTPAPTTWLEVVLLPLPGGSS